MRGAVLVLACLALACQSDVSSVPDAATDASDAHAAFWTYQLPQACTGKRRCVDAHGRFWANGQPWFPRGVYNGGIEYLQVLSNCPADAACQEDPPIADPDVMIWFGPDELDLNDFWPMAAGIRRILRGSSPALDALLAGPYAPTDMSPYLPATEPVHDTLGLPFEAALYSAGGLAQGTNVYDARRGRVRGHRAHPASRGHGTRDL